jgi:Ser/Thr protein kinase RdoA (MazF antagonist)
MKPFHQLTARGQSRRLRQLALAALQQYDLPWKGVRTLANAFNTLFRVDCRDGRIYVLRVNLPGWRKLGEIKAEMHWLAALQAETTLGVPWPLPNLAGKLVTTAAAPGVPEPRSCAVFSWVPGKNLSQQLTTENWARLGAFMAQLHIQAAGYVLPSTCKLEVHRTVLPIKQPNRLFDGSAGSLIAPAQRELFWLVYKRVEAVLEWLYQEKTVPRILHADLHQGNVRVSRGRLHALDFDDCLLGHPIQDIGISLFYLLGQPHYDQLRDAFQQGYTDYLPWPEDYPGQLDTLIVGRGLQLVNFFLNSNSPQHREFAPQFIAYQQTHIYNYLKATPAPSAAFPLSWE